MMATIQELFPKAQGDGWFIPPADYSAVIASLGHEVLLVVDDEDYQGDSRVLLRDGERYGILVFGWGSCSGCDALQGCENYEDLAKLRDELITSIEWSTREKTLARIQNKDWAGTHLAPRETARFIEQAVEILETAA